MTLRSLKKRRITARMFSPAKRFSLALMLAGLTASSVTAQTHGPQTHGPQTHGPQTHGPQTHGPQTHGPAQWQSAADGRSAVQARSYQARSYPVPAANQAVVLRPVPREGSRVAAPVAHNPQHDGWNLKWRRSEQVAEPAVATAAPVATGEVLSRPQATADVFDLPAGEVPRAELPAAAVPAVDYGGSANLRPQSTVAQTAWLAPQQDQGAFELPPNLRTDPPAEPPKVDLFSDPFADELPVPKASGDSKAPADDSTIDPARPSDPRPMNELRSGNQSAADRSEPAGDASDSPRLEPPSRADAGPSLGEMLREQRPSGNESSPKQRDVPLPPQAPAIDPVKPSEVPMENPFDQRPKTKGNTYSQRIRGDINLSEGVTCDAFRTQIAKETIDQLSLDISPPFRPDVVDPAEYEDDLGDFLEKQAIRTWRKVDGTELAKGRLRDLAYENAIIETEYGALEQLPVNRLSEGDLAYLSENWGLPKECVLEQVAYTPRSWTAITMTWHASDLCHKPLYFEEVNLERYGHTAGPVLQPVVSSAHFFANIAVLPYKMGVHTPGECQYALGYYRPGDCAPWIIPPVPISLRGGLSQAAVMTGMFWLIP